MPDSTLFESIVNSLQESIFLFDRKAAVVFVNRSGEEMFSRSLKDMTGRTFDQIVPGGKRISALARKTIREARSFRGKSVSLDLPHATDVDFTLSPLYRRDRVDGAVLTVSRNIHFADRETYDFDSLVMLIGTIAHEIKNPLAGIRGAAQLLRSARGTAASEESVDLIVRETDRLNKILQDYLTLCRRPSFHPVNVHEVLEKALSVLKVPLETAGITVRRLYDPSLPQVMGDEGKLFQVFLNLLKNGLESMSRGGTLEMMTSPSRESFRDHGRTKRWAVIAIKDTGKGIDEADLQKIFFPFYTKKKTGTGIGLALSKKVISDHGGFINVKSQQGKGTTFFVYIPFGYHE